MNFEDPHNTNIEDSIVEVMNAIRDLLLRLDFDLDKASKQDAININNLIIEKLIANRDDAVVASVILALASIHIRSLIED